MNNKYKDVFKAFSYFVLVVIAIYGTGAILWIWPIGN